MPRLPLLLSTLLLSSAHATRLDFSTSGQTPAPHTTFQIGFSELPTGKGESSLHLSTQAASFSYRQSLTLAPLGALSSQTELAHPWGGGLRLSSHLSGTVGPVALQIRGEGFNAPINLVHPQALWTEEAADLRTRGWNLSASGRYRVSRNLIAGAGAEFGGQPNAFAEIETRRDLTSKTTEEGEELGTADTLLLRAGARAGRGVIGLSAGTTYRRDSGLEARADLLLGPQPSFSGRLTLPPLGESNLSFYGVYEPWRLHSAPLRYGAEWARDIGPGTLSVNLRGGRGPSGTSGHGFELRYSLPLGQTEESEQSEQSTP